MHIEATQTFLKLYKKLPGQIQEKTRQTLEIFQNNPSHPSLGHKKMAGYENIYELNFFFSNKG